MTNSTPEAAFRYGRVHAAVWSRPGKRGDGTSFTQWSVSLERRYKDKAGTWQSTSTFDPQDILDASLALEDAYRFLRSEQQKQNRAKVPAAAAAETR